jgi:phosphoribosylglycinamide formyltransferase-1
MAILDAIDAGDLRADVAVVVSNQPSALGLKLAKERGLQTQAMDPKTFDSFDAYEHQIVTTLTEHGVDLLVLAGYMKLVGDPILTAFCDRMVNIHPSLLPSFKGLNAPQQALDYGVKVAGCTVHFVIKDMDAGPIIDQAVVPVHDDDTVDTLSERILVEEHRLFPRAIQWVLDHHL